MDYRKSCSDSMLLSGQEGRCFTACVVVFPKIARAGKLEREEGKGKGVWNGARWGKTGQGKVEDGQTGPWKGWAQQQWQRLNPNYLASVGRPPTMPQTICQRTRCCNVQV